jgi:tryptophan-rich sensory protein
MQQMIAAAWSGLFFGLRSPGTTRVDIVLLWCAILTTVIAFWWRSTSAGSLTLPYRVRKPKPVRAPFSLLYLYA